MARLLQMGDNATPLDSYDSLPVFAFYLFGQTPHVWEPDEVRGITSRWALPIAVNLDDAADYTADADEYAARLAALGWEKGTTVSLDTEDTVQPRYIPGFDARMLEHGYPLMHYESADVQGSNPATSGGRWLARWLAGQALPPGALALQYASAQEAGTPWDCSVISANVRLHELNPISAPGGQHVQVSAVMPVLAIGSSGYAVRLLQGMVTAALDLAPSPDMSDGTFGPVTAGHVGDWQHLYGIEDAPGTAGPETWASLLTRS